MFQLWDAEEASTSKALQRYGRPLRHMSLLSLLTEAGIDGLHMLHYMYLQLSLPAEIVEYTSPDETAVCNLASIALPRYVRERGCEPGREAKKLVGSLDAETR
jgi:hypothetical protein